jgi:glycosyltransferase-like protein
LIPVELIPADQEALDDRIQRYIQTYYQYLSKVSPDAFDIYHAQDCISANALWRLRNDGLITAYVRTVHHVDDFTSPALVECQKNSILRPDYRIVVSRYWQKQLVDEFQVDSAIIYNGVNLARFQPATPAERRQARSELGLGDQFVFLNIGGIEPRKNSVRLLRAFQAVQPALNSQGLTPVLLFVGGDTLLDYSPYRNEFFEEFERSQLRVGQDLFFPGVVADEQIPLFYQAADVLAFPSVKEGWGLVVLEAMASGLPVLASNLPVFHEYLRSEENALLVDPASDAAIAAAMRRLVDDHPLRQRLALAGPATAEKFSWKTTAKAHVEFYESIQADTVSNQVSQKCLTLEGGV